MLAPSSDGGYHYRVLRFVLALVLFAAAPPARDGATVSGKVTVSKDAKKKAVIIRYTGTKVETRKEPAASLAVVWIKGAPAAKTEPRKVEIVQQGLEFRPRVVAVPVESRIDFPNGDDLFHNVFSLSPGNDFDLGKYPKGDPDHFRTFPKKGRIDLRCHVHDHMRAYIHVFDHPYFAVAAEDGSYSIPQVPPGKYTLVVWKEDYQELQREIEVKAEGLKVDVEIVRSQERPAGRDVYADCCAAR